MPTDAWPTVWGSMPPFADDPDRACKTSDTDLFFPEHSGTNGGKAKAICARCPLAKACADFAIPQPALRGIWGGLTEPERERIRLGRPAPVRKPAAPRSPELRAAAAKAAAKSRTERTLADIADLAAVGLEVDEIVELSGHSRRTVFRYLKMLQEAADGSAGAPKSRTVAA